MAYRFNPFTGTLQFVEDGYTIQTRSDNSNPAVFTDETARDAYYNDSGSANPNTLAAARGTLSGSTITDIQVFWARIGGEWVVVPTNLTGSRGPAGASGNSYFFASESAQDTFFNVGTNKSLLEQNLPITVNEDGRSAPFPLLNRFLSLILLGLDPYITITRTWAMLMNLKMYSSGYKKRAIL